MATMLVKEDLTVLAETAAELVCKSLTDAIAAYGQAVWLLAGGTAPMGAYRVLADKYKEIIDWERVWVAMGDERCVQIGNFDSNWLQASTVLLDRVSIPETNKLRPTAGLIAEKEAELYEASLMQLPQKEPGIPRLNHVWLGVGEDGHTLSLFPGQFSFEESDKLVIAVHDSPKPPPDRISLTLKALAGTESCLIMATGASKAVIVARAFQGDTSLPIVQAMQAIEATGGRVVWLLDAAAASLM